MREEERKKQRRPKRDSRRNSKTPWPNYSSNRMKLALEWSGTTSSQNKGDEKTIELPKKEGRRPIV